MLRAHLVIAVLAALLVLPQAAQGRTWRVNLDRDGARERVTTQKSPCRKFSPYGCTRLVLRDGRRRVVLTPFTQRPRYPYGWRVRKVRFRDFTGDGRKEILWDLRTSGGTASSPSALGVHRWSGRRARRIFRFRNARKPPRGYSYVAFVTWSIVRRGGLPQIRTKESLHRSGDATCCPSAYRVMRHRWNGRRIGRVRGSARIEDA